MKIISLFNNKGGVGKTTFLFHVGHVLADTGRNVLMVDCDSQCNLTAYALSDKAIEKAWEEGGNSIYRAIEPVARGLGDIRNRAPSVLRPELVLGARRPAVDRFRRPAWRHMERSKGR